MPVFHLNTDTTVAAGQIVDQAVDGGVGYLVDQGPAGPDFTNLGAITFTQGSDGAGATAVELAPGSGINWLDGTVDNEGHLTVSAFGPTGALLSESPLTILNNGTISVTSATVADAIDVGDHRYVSFVDSMARLVTNNGQVLVSGGTSVTGVYQAQGGALTNTGLIQVTGTAPGAVVHGVWSQVHDYVQNSGQIIATDDDPTVDSVAVHLTGDNSVVINSGTITGDIAIEDINPSVLGSEVQEIKNSGVINGRIEIALNGYPGLIQFGLENDGTINGDVNLGPGSQTFVGMNGVQHGLVSGGDGADLLYGGAFADALQGNQGDDDIYGEGGDDIIVGGKDNDHQNGGDGNDVVWGNLGDDYVSGDAGADQVRGGQGDDILFGGDGDDYVSGDRGNDTISGGAGADRFHGSQDAGIDKVLDFNPAEGDRVMLDPGTHYTLSQVGADTVIDMGGGNQMILVGIQLSSLKDGWILESF